MSARNYARGICAALITFAVTASADDQRSTVKVEGVNSNSGDTSILIKKGDVSNHQCIEYQIVDGIEEIAGDPGIVKAVAQKNWKTACADWKKQTKDLNSSAKNSLLALNCGTANAVQDGTEWVYRSNGSYKLKVRTREKP